MVLLHGGYWRAVYTRRLMRHLAADVASRGWMAYNAEYRRVGLGGGGGGWTATFDDVAAAVDHLRHVDGVDTTRIVTCGHSAGGHLALWAAARHRLPPGAPGAQPAIRPAAAVSLAGVVDLIRADALRLGNGAVTGLLGGRADHHADRYAQASPAALLPLGVPQVLVHGLDDTVVPASLSEGYVEAARQAGDGDAAYVPVPGAGHLDMIDPSTRAWSVTLDHLHRLLDRPA